MRNKVESRSVGSKLAEMSIDPKRVVDCRLTIPPVAPLSDAHIDGIAAQIVQVQRDCLARLINIARNGDEESQSGLIFHVEGIEPKQQPATCARLEQRVRTGLDNCGINMKHVAVLWDYGTQTDISISFTDINLPGRQRVTAFNSFSFLPDNT